MAKIIKPYNTKVVNPVKNTKPVAKESSSDASSLAARVLNGSKKPTLAESRSLAASVLSQDQTRGQGKPKK